ncbi:MAG: hypothetical protein ABI641_15525, partial [Caldimonas sp.]
MSAAPTAPTPATPAIAAPAPRRPRLPLDGYLLLRDQVRGTFMFNRTSLAGHIVGAAVVVLMFADVAPASLLVRWGAAFLAVWLVRLGLAWRFSRNEPGTTAGLRRRLRLWQVGVLASGALWGLAAWLLYGYGSALHQIALILVVYTFCVASVPILAPQYRLFAAFVLLIFVPAVAVVARQPARLAWELAIVMSVAIAMIMILARNFRDQFNGVVTLKLRTEALADQLRAEKIA